MLLSSAEFRDKLEVSLEASNERIIVLSAFVKLHALKWLFAHSKVNNISVVARWRPYDLTCGASDLQCYEFCRDKGIPFGILLDLHGKVYCVDNYILVGSANLTSRGMGLSKEMNNELGIGFLGGVADKNKIEGLLSGVTWLNDELLVSMQAALEKSDEHTTSENSTWPDSILAQITTPTTHLWVHELPFCCPKDLIEYGSNGSSNNHDFALLDLDPSEVDFQQLLIAFRRSRAFCWLAELVDVEGSASFGKVTAELHRAILDDPTPYRQEIKSLVSVLLDWAKFYPDHFLIERPRHSTIIRKV